MQLSIKIFTEYRKAGCDMIKLIYQGGGVLFDARAELERLRDEKYRDFHSALVPNVEKERVIGVRLPQIRSLASKIIKQDETAEFLASPVGDSLEEKLLRGFVIAKARLPLDEHLAAVADFVPLIDCWSVCDSFVASLKFIKEERMAVWDFLQPYFDSPRAYDVRFAVVVTLDYFADTEYAERAFKWFDMIDNDDYYVKTALAWAVSVFFVHAPEATWGYLEKCSLDDFTFNKALQKITESYRVSLQDKKKIRSMKRR